MKKKLLVLAALATATLMTGAVRSSMAALQLKLATAGSATVTVTDNGAGDTNTAVGQITFNGSIGAFSTVITAGTSNSPGANGLAILQTHSISVRDLTNSAASLTVSFSDTNFSNPIGNNMTLGSSFAGTFLSGTSGESVSFQSYADGSNTAFGTAITSGLHTATLANGATTPAGFTTADRTASFSDTGTYSMTDVTTINLSANGQANVSGTTSVSVPGGAGVPEPASLGMMGLGLVGLLARRRRIA